MVEKKAAVVTDRPLRAETELLTGTSEVEEEDLDHDVRELSYHTWSSLVNEQWWLWETLACLYSLMLAITVVIVLYCMNGKPAPNLRHDFTLHGLVAIASSTCKASVVVSIAEGISQLKWTYFSRKSRNLYDFEVFDQASRGAWGSVKLLGTMGTSSMACLGALAIVLALGFEASVQQSITYPIVPVRADYNSTIVQVSTGGPFFVPNERNGNVSLADVVTASIGMTDLKTAVPPQGVDCRGQYCTWQNLTTTGICSSCDSYYFFNDCAHNRNHTFCKEHNSTFRFRNHSVSVAPDQVMLYTTSDPQESLNYFNVSSFIVSTYSVKWKNDGHSGSNDSSPDVNECVLYYCEHIYNLTYMDRYFTPVDVDENILDLTDVPPSDDQEAADTSSQLTNQTLIEKAQLASNLTQRLTGYISRNESQGLITLPSVTFKAYTNLERDLSNFMNNISFALSVAIWNSDTGGQLADGMVWNEQTQVHIRWRWLVLPAVVQLLAIAFLMYSVINSWQHEREGVWKSSALVVLFHTLEPEERSKLGKVETLRRMKYGAQSVSVRLRRNKEGYRQLVNVDKPPNKS